MLQLNYAWDIYMKAFCPRVRPLPFVDNLSLVAHDTGHVAWGYTCLATVFELWNLRTDTKKSHSWSTCGVQRKQLVRLPFACVDSAHELGGVLSFTKKRYTGGQLPRLRNLAGRWFQLQSSQAPLALKLHALPAVFWASGLHGIAGSCLGENHIDHLRAQAMKALRLNKAGANGILRLSLSTTPTADPGFWRLHHTVMTCQRLLRKEPCLLNHWIHYHHCFDGSLFRGPCSQLLVVSNQVGWKEKPPNLIDHDECIHDLLHLDSTAFMSFSTMPGCSMSRVWWLIVGLWWIWLFATGLGWLSAGRGFSWELTALQV